MQLVVCRACSELDPHSTSLLFTTLVFLSQQTIHDASNSAEVNRVLAAGGFLSSTGRFQGILEPSRTIGDVDVKAEAPNGVIASFPELFKVDIASDIFQGDETPAVPPFLVLATDGIWDEASASTVVAEVKDGIKKIQAHKRRFIVSKKNHRRARSAGSTSFTDAESDTDKESEFCGSGEWAERGVSIGLHFRHHGTFQLVLFFSSFFVCIGQSCDVFAWVMCVAGAYLEGCFFSCLRLGVRPLEVVHDTALTEN